MLKSSKYYKTTVRNLGKERLKKKKKRGILKQKPAPSKSTCEYDRLQQLHYNKAKRSGLYHNYLLENHLVKVVVQRYVRTKNLVVLDILLSKCKISFTAAFKNQNSSFFLNQQILVRNMKCITVPVSLPLGGGAFRFKGTGFRQMISRTSCV